MVQPSFKWAVASGVGSIDGAGLFYAGSVAGTATIAATSGPVAGSAAILVINAAPTVATTAAATPNPITGTTTSLSVLGSDDGGESNLTYTWTVTAEPAGAVEPTFSDNGHNTAKDTTATFYKAGSYTFLVTITDAGGLTTTSSVGVTVNQSLTTITVSPPTASLNENQTQSFSAVAYDQFGTPLMVQPSFNWAVASGVGSIDGAGLFYAGSVAGTATIAATSGPVAGSAAILVTNAAPTVATPATATPNPITGTTTSLSVLGSDDGGESNLTYTWTVTAEPAGAVEPNFSDNGHNTAKDTTATFYKAGSYTFLVTITDAGGLSTTSSVPVSAPNQSPMAVVPGLQRTAQNEPIAFSRSGGNAISVIDPHAGLNRVQVALSLTQGTLSLPDSSGLNVTATSSGSAMVTLTGRIDDLNAALDGLRFAPPPGFAGTAWLMVEVNDLGNTGTAGAGSDAEIVPISVTNIAPVLADNAPLTLNPIAEDVTPPANPGPTLPEALHHGADLVTVAFGPSAGNNFPQIVVILGTPSNGTGTSGVGSAGSSPSAGITTNTSVPPRPAQDGGARASTGNGHGSTSAASAAGVGGPASGPALVVPAAAGINGVLAAVGVEASPSGSRGNAIAATTTTVKITATAIKSVGEKLTIDSPALWHDLDRMGEQFTGGIEVKAMTVAAVTGMTMSVGYVVWTIRANYLIAGLLAGVPLWKQLDPLEVLEQVGAGAKKTRGQTADREDEDQEETLLDLLKRPDHRVPQAHWPSRSKKRRHVKVVSERDEVK
jgi:hypothetical protein